ncbi:proliferating cell nuclear antigen (pcna) [Candidatus Woesearchaeota archaeon]|nr:proliferating cell nuclear antigen (pcna) [Candidatus Woesearchaeota archaeon]
MKLTLAEPRYLKDSISIISELVNETRIKVGNEGLELISMDPANVAMVIFKLLPTAFAEYKVEQPVDIAVNLTNLKQILRRANPTDILTLELAENKLKIQLKSSSTRTFNLPIIDIEEKEQKAPELKFPISIQTPSALLNEAITDADVVAESVSFSAKQGMFSMHAEGDLNTAAIEIKEDENTKINTTQEAKSKYSVEYLKKMIEGSKLADTVKIEFNKDYPLKLTYASVDKLMLSFILAPRVDTD